MNHNNFLCLTPSEAPSVHESDLNEASIAVAAIDKFEDRLRKISDDVSAGVEIKQITIHKSDQFEYIVRGVVVWKFLQGDVCSLEMIWLTASGERSFYSRVLDSPFCLEVGSSGGAYPC